MSVPRLPSLPDYTSTGGHQIPEHWYTTYIDTYYASAVATVMSQTDIESGSKITKFGDTVHMRQRMDVTAKDYVVGQELEIEFPQAPSIDLVVDKADYCAFGFNKVDEHQMDQDAMEETAKDAAAKMKLKGDKRFLDDIEGTPHRFNMGAMAGRDSRSINLGTSGAPIALTKDNVVDLLMAQALVLDEQDVPAEGRYAVIPPAMRNLISRSELRQVYLSGDKETMLRQGYVGTIGGFDLYESRLLPRDGTGAAAKITTYFGIPYALSFVTQLTENERENIVRGFGRFEKRLQVYGYKNKKPEAFGRSIITIAAAALNA